MKEAIHFRYDGISSRDMGVYVVSENGLLEENFLPVRSIIETKTPYRKKPYFERVDYEPLEFTLTFFCEEWKNRQTLRHIIRWLNKDWYKPMSFDTNPERIFYCMPVGESIVHHNGRKEGYVTMSFRCDSAYSYSQPMQIDNILSSDGQTSFLNDGDSEVMPKMWITKTVSGGDISITVQETGQKFTLNNLTLNEVVYINNAESEIISDGEPYGIYHYDDHNGEWITFDIGETTLIFEGDFMLNIEFQTTYLAD